MAMPDNRLDREYDKFIEDASGKTAVNTNLVVQDIEIGAVEIKDHDGEDRAEVNAVNALKTQEIKPTAVVQHILNVTTAGSAQLLSDSGSTTVGVTIKAKVGNTGNIYVGTVTMSSSNGYPLAPGDTLSMAIANTNNITVDADVDGEGLHYLTLHAPD